MSIENGAGDGDEGQGTSLRDDLRTALEEATARDEAAFPASDTVDAGGGNDTLPAGDGGEGGQPRAPNGRFAPKAAGEGGDQGGAPAAAAAADPAAPAAAASAAAPGADEAPASWRGNAKAAWANIPADARSEILRREREAADLAGRMDGERRFGREFAEIVRPHMETIQRFGVTPQFAVQTLLNNDRVMRFGKPEEKLALARKMIADYGLDMGQLGQPDPNAPSDPHVAALQREIAELKGRLGAPAPQNVAPLPQSEGDATVHDAIEAFRSDPAHPHFDQVIDKMTALIESGHASGLDDAYDMAVASNPTLRSTGPAQQQPPEPQRQSQAAAEKTAAARRAGASVSSSPGSPGGNARPASLRDELREQLRQHGFS